MKNLKAGVIAALVAVASSYAVFYFLTPAPSTFSSSQISKSANVYERVINSGEIQCGYASYPPFHYKDLNTGEHAGIGYEVIEKAGDLLNLEIHWVREVSPSSMLESIISGKLDMICTPFWHVAEESRVVDFTMPVLYTAMDVWVRANDKRFQKLEDLNDDSVTISTLDGATIGHIVRQRFPKATTLSIPELAPLSDLMVNVASGKADAVLIENTQAEGFLKNNPGTLKKLDLGKPIRVYANAFPVPIGDQKFESMINGALQELHNDGFIERQIESYHQDYPASLLKRDPPYRLR